MRSSRRAGVALCALGVSWGAVAAAAEESQPDRARALFKEARGLVADGKYADACPKFEQSLKLDVGIGTKFNLADCYEHTDRPVAARGLFLDVAEIAHASGQPEREHAARERADALGPKIPKLVIDVKVGDPKLDVKLDQTSVPPASWGAPLELEPGPHDVVATAPGKKRWTRHVDAVVAEKPTVVEVPELRSDAPPPPVPVAKEPPKEEAPRAETKAEDEPPPKGPDNTVPIILYAGAGAGAILATTSFILYKVSNDHAKNVCPTSLGCTEADVRAHTDHVRDAQTMRTLGYVGLGIAGASLAGAAIVLLARPTPHERPPSARNLDVSPLVGRGEVGAAVAGSF